MRKRYIIEVTNRDEMVVFCPQSVMEGHTLKKIAFGSKSVEVTFAPLPAKKERIIISRKIKDALYFPDLGVPLHLF
jgi:hypothetical protein